MAGRRGNNEGSIFKRTDGRWEARVSLPDGKRKGFYGKTRQEVAKKLSETLHDKDQGILPTDGRQTLGQFLDFWIKVKALNLRESSLMRYKAHLHHLIAGLGKVQLGKLTPQVLQSFYMKALNEGLSAAAVHDMHAILHGALEHAVSLGLVYNNVTDRVKAPRKVTREMATLSEEQVRMFLKAAQGDRLEALYMLVVTTGMREGELLALRWKDIDFERGLVQVRVNLQQVPKQKGNYIISDTKTSYSQRSIALSKAVLEALRHRRFLHETEVKTLGEAWNKEFDLVFPRVDGHWIYPTNLRRDLFRKLLRKAGLPQIRFHDLRHTAATLLLLHGINPKIVSEMLGHSTVSITLDIYSHVTPHMQQIAADVMDVIIHGSP